MKVMPLPLIGAAIEAGGSLLGNLVQGWQNKDLAGYQNDLNMKSWLMQQEYNSPANQMARYKAAGLNPNLIYGQGNSGNAASPVQLQAPAPAPWKSSFDKIGQAAQTYLDYKSRLLGIEAQQKQNDILDQEYEGKLTDNSLKQDASIRSAYLTYGDLVKSGRFSGGRYAGYSSPYTQQLQYQFDARQQAIQGQLIKNTLESEYRGRERALALKRGEQAYELERYTKDPLFYYGNKAVDKLLDFIPKTKGGSFNRGLKPMSENSMIDKLRGMGHSVRRGVYKP